ncbi:hypothetical protein ABH892_005057 [Paenibacillus sp. RC254]
MAYSTSGVWQEGSVSSASRLDRNPFPDGIEQVEGPYFDFFLGLRGECEGDRHERLTQARASLYVRTRQLTP